MRIGLIAPPWVPVPPPAYGGLESVVDRLARGLARAGHDVLLAAAANSTCPVDLVPGMEDVPPDAPITGDTITELAHVAKAYAAMSGMDVIHDHTIAGPLYRHRPVGVPVVVTNHGPFEPRPNLLFHKMQSDTTIVAISHHQASTACDVQIDRVIHHGLDVDDIAVGPGGTYAAFLGRMCEDKGPRQAIEVARLAGMPLKIAAKMREEAELCYFRANVEPLLGGDIEYVGEVDEAGKYQLLGNAIVLLNPIQWAEPFGLVMIEALACGTPVVATRAGSVPEIIQDALTGFIRDDHAGLAQGLLRANDLDRKVCRKVAETQFSTARMVADHVELYRQLHRARQRGLDAAVISRIRRGLTLV
ncbi:MAG TPA: glycosyltransferase family 4 protein [Propionibacteriaceae bacterium]|nr:glycosyltransferase family 4 protein [Propionibacteriaceae bacterium]